MPKDNAIVVQAHIDTSIRISEAAFEVLGTREVGSGGYDYTRGTYVFTFWKKTNAEKRSALEEVFGKTFDFPIRIDDKESFSRLGASSSVQSEPKP